MEIERKFIPLELPFSLSDFPYHEIEQAYLLTSPVVRIRKEDDKGFYLECLPVGADHTECRLFCLCRQSSAGKKK